MNIHDVREPWTEIRSAIATADWPTNAEKNTYNPVTTATHRLVTHMVDYEEAELIPINLSYRMGISELELRTTFNDATATATMCVFAAREGDTAVKRVASIAWAAGTQTDAAGRYFGTTATVTSYWPSDIGKSAVETGTGICSVWIDTLGYNRFWIAFSAINASDNVSAEFSGVSR